MIGRWIECIKWWLRYRSLRLKPGCIIIITYPNSRMFTKEYHAKVIKAWWERPRYAIDPHVPDLGRVFLGGWQLHVLYGSLYGLVNQCRDGVHIRKCDA